MAEIEFNKDGSISRKRLHSGNLPSIPRTEECHICSAKFTRYVSPQSDHLCLPPLTHPPPPNTRRLNHLKRHILTREPRYQFIRIVNSINGDWLDTDSRRHECEVNRLDTKSLHQLLPTLTEVPLPVHPERSPHKALTNMRKTVRDNHFPRPALTSNSEQ